MENYTNQRERLNIFIRYFIRATIINGGPDRIRTCYFRFRKLALYPNELQDHGNPSRTRTYKSQSRNLLAYPISL